MKDLFYDFRPDKDFDLTTLTYKEIFDGLKFGVAKTISKFSKEEVLTEDLKLNEERCYIKMAFAEDMNLYPKIYLDLVGAYSILLTPFNVELLEIKHSVKTLSCVELRECFYNFMCNTFPQSNYEKIYERI